MILGGIAAGVGIRNPNAGSTRPTPTPPGGECGHSADCDDARNVAFGREPAWLTGEPIIFSGIQPTGRKHLGNFIGAIRQYVEGQDRGDPAIFCVVDLHSISVPYDPADLRERVLDTAAILLAAGLDPERCIFFRQSDVREHTELTWLLSRGHRPRRPRPHDPVQGKGRQGARAGLGGALLLPGADGRRRARLPRATRCRSATTSASTWS